MRRSLVILFLGVLLGGALLFSFLDRRSGRGSEPILRAVEYAASPPNGSTIHFFRLPDAPPRKPAPFPSQLMPTVHTLSSGPVALTRMLKMVQTFGRIPIVLVQRDLAEEYGYAESDFQPKGYKFEQDRSSGRTVNFSGGGGSRKKVLAIVEADLGRVGIAVLRIHRRIALVVRSADTNLLTGAAAEDFSITP